MKRRTFIKLASTASGAFIAQQLQASSLFSFKEELYFTLHQTIESNPDAVFLMKTNVYVKTNAALKKEAGKVFGQSIFN